jgi:hemerythrin-like metal-binding protein
VDSKYILGIDELDSQHEEIETIFVTLQEALEDKAQRKNLPEILESLREKLRFHFYAEESIMQIFAYPEFQEHRRMHMEILKSVESFNANQPTAAEIKKLREQPLQLFFEQIISQDLRFAKFIQRNKERMGIA